MEFEKQGVKCKMFWDVQAMIKNAEAKMKVAQSNLERRYYAQDILLEVETLSSCANFNSAGPECISCHAVLRNYSK